ncbi:hypothetical protein [Pseudoalteromonas sp. S16_S37]|uniref:hypothetical protein n=1 Tax=Pseudoalteromonas sp. S16_S37 TaxID=2720228 RepID=UPI0016813F3F|nr:hypothetical protein [Pseudoalteromonas sp. S16_S37]MBD1584689.1 hypothetical protein [Pseudoalteromonas sp. S16_S37]
MKIQFNKEDILALINDIDKREKLKLALDSIVRHQLYCKFHYEEFNKAFNFHGLAMFGELPSETEMKNPQYYCCVFESHAFAFFRALHSLIESVPYIVNILIGREKVESRHLNWETAKNSLNKRGAYTLENYIIKLKNEPAYKQLDNLVNISKHRRLPQIDSGVFSGHATAKFINKEFDYNTCHELSVPAFMEESYQIIEPFVVKFVFELAEYLGQSNSHSHSHKKP